MWGDTTGDTMIYMGGYNEHIGRYSVDGSQYKLKAFIN